MTFQASSIREDHAVRRSPRRRRNLSECVVREIHEELSFFVPPERFEPIAQRGGPDNEVLGGIVHAEIFVTREVPVDELFVTEGRLKIVRVRELGEIAGELTPSALFGLRALTLV